MNILNTTKILKFITFLFLSLFLLNACGIYKPVDARKQPQQAKEKASKNVSEGRGVALGNILGGRGGSTNYEFSSSNPLWRASLEIIDFLPLATVDYSGGVIITDWYNDSQSQNEAIKLTIRFLGTEIRSNSVKVIVHKKKCSPNMECRVNEIKSKIKDELQSAILNKAAEFDKASKKK